MLSDEEVKVLFDNKYPPEYKLGDKVILVYKPTIYSRPYEETCELIGVIAKVIVYNGGISEPFVGYRIKYTIQKREDGVRLNTDKLSEIIYQQKRLKHFYGKRKINYVWGRFGE